MQVKKKTKYKSNANTIEIHIQRVGSYHWVNYPTMCRGKTARGETLVNSQQSTVNSQSTSCNSRQLNKWNWANLDLHNTKNSALKLTIFVLLNHFTIQFLPNELMIYK